MKVSSSTQYWSAYMGELVIFFWWTLDAATTKHTKKAAYKMKVNFFPLWLARTRWCWWWKNARDYKLRCNMSFHSIILHLKPVAIACLSKKSVLLNNSSTTREIQPQSCSAYGMCVMVCWNPLPNYEGISIRLPNPKTRTRFKCA